MGYTAIKIGSRLAGIISLSGLQCGWDGMIAPPGHDVACMKMLVNIYVYAMCKVGSQPARHVSVRGLKAVGILSLPCC